MIHGYQTWSEEPLMQVKDDDGLHGDQGSNVVKYKKLSFMMATKLGQKITDDDDDFHRAHLTINEVIFKVTPKNYGKVIQGHFKVTPGNSWEGHCKVRYAKIQGHTYNLQISKIW